MRGVTTVVGLVLAPHFSRFSVGQYHERAAVVASERGVDYRPIDHWHLLPAYVDFLADALTTARGEVPANHKVLFTAHSLPERVLADDPYPDELRASAEAVADARRAEPVARLGAVLAERGAHAGALARSRHPRGHPRAGGHRRGSDGVVVCPQGFTADHLEVLYDLDIEARKVAADAGLAFAAPGRSTTTPR